MTTARVPVVLCLSLVAVGWAISAAVASDAASSAGKRYDRNGISFEYPRSWYVTTEPLSNGENPKYRFTVSTNPVRRTATDLGPCLPGIAAQLPPSAVLVYLREALGADRRASLPGMQRRPESFRLPAQSDNGLCGFRSGRWVPFKSGGRAFYFGMYVGARASPASTVALARIVNGMKIRAVGS
jgi:hypothetical protein